MSTFQLGHTLRLSHGHAARGKVSRTYKSWRSMVKRCTNPNYPWFKNHGGRGITVCERWLDFENFLADMGERPPGLTLERKDNDKGYSIDNCEWATPAQQSKNRRSTKWITVGNETLCFMDWARRLGLSDRGLRHRLKKQTIEEIVNQAKPSRKRPT